MNFLFDNKLLIKIYNKYDIWRR